MRPDLSEPRALQAHVVVGVEIVQTVHRRAGPEQARGRWKPMKPAAPVTSTRCASRPGSAICMLCHRPDASDAQATAMLWRMGSPPTWCRLVLRTSILVVQSC